MKGKNLPPNPPATLNRRQFLAWQAGSLCLTAGGLHLFPLAGRASGTAADLAVAIGAPEAATREAVRLLGGINRFVKSGSRVVIKPNMSFSAAPERASNTNPEVVRTLAALCREAGAARISVLDNPLGPAERCIEGIRDACRLDGKGIVHAVQNRSLFSPVAIPKGETLKTTDVMEEVLKADVLIAVPVAKSHGTTGVSLSMKGMMGLIWDRSAMHRDHDLDAAIVDLASLLKPHLVVIDASRVLSSNGPGGPGLVLEPRTIIASRDMVAADAFAVERFPWYGQRLKASQVRHIRLAQERKLGRMDIANLTVLESRA
ncbi:MAG: DUF362 domain-containing protein [Deltaproteobacteria bacterium]|nr:DUF362 domain-containing protein [Deltaproteobacteria bacterium]